MSTLAPTDRPELADLMQRLRAVVASMGDTIAALDRLADSVEADRGEVEGILERLEGGGGTMSDGQGIILVLLFLVVIAWDMSRTLRGIGLAIQDNTRALDEIRNRIDGELDSFDDTEEEPEVPQ